MTKNLNIKIISNIWKIKKIRIIKKKRNNFYNKEFFYIIVFIIEIILTDFSLVRNFSLSPN